MSRFDYDPYKCHWCGGAINWNKECNCEKSRELSETVRELKEMEEKFRKRYEEAVNPQLPEGVLYICRYCGFPYRRGDRPGVCCRWAEQDWQDTCEVNEENSRSTGDDKFSIIK